MAATATTIARYDFAASGVVARLDGGANAGEAAGDTYANIEALYGSAFGDYLIGNSAGNVLAGLDGADLLYGLGGDDILLGGGGADAFAFNTVGFGTDTVQTSPPRLRQAPTTTMSTSAASAPSAASPSRRSVPMRISSPTTAPSSCRASRPRPWSRATSCSELRVDKIEPRLFGQDQAMVQLLEGVRPLRFQSVACCRFRGRAVKLIPPSARTQPG